MSRSVGEGRTTEWFYNDGSELILSATFDGSTYSARRHTYDDVGRVELIEEVTGFDPQTWDPDDSHELEAFRTI